MTKFGSAFLDSIKNRFSNNEEMVDTIEKALFLNKNSVYRRVRGDTDFTFDEVCTLAQAMGLSLDQLIHPQNNVANCTHRLYNKNDNSLEAFLYDTLQTFRKAIELKNIKLFYSSKGLPFFILLNSPKLLAFKLFVWEVGSWNVEKIHEHKFSTNWLSERHLDMAREIYQCYGNIPSYEIWSKTILESTFEQINYLRSVNCLDDTELVVEILQELNDVVLEAKKLTDAGKKTWGSQPAEFHLYQSELFNATNNVFYVESDELSFVSWTFCDPDYVISQDPALCDRASLWLKNLIHQSNGLTNHSLKNRNEFFGYLSKQIELEIQKL